jgi:hypothetical protein
MEHGQTEGDRQEDWAVLRQFLPTGWEEAARKTGALRRARGVDGAESLLRILLIHLSCGCSLAETAARAQATGLGQLSAVALFKRLQASEEWLRWLAMEERRLLAGPQPATGRRLRAVDATVVSEPGSTGTNWRLHYAINLTDLQCDFFEITDVKGGETIRRVPIAPGNIVVGDRLYSNPIGVAHVVGAGGDVLFRLNWKMMPLYQEDGKVVNPVAAVRKLKVGETCDLPTWVVPKEGDAIPGRLIAMRRSAAATRLSKWRGRPERRRKNYRLRAVKPRSSSWFGRALRTNYRLRRY